MIFTEDARKEYCKTLQNHAAFWGEAYEDVHHDILSVVESQNIESIRKFVANHHKVASMMAGVLAKKENASYITIETANIRVALWNTSLQYIMRFTQ